jgi:hypothetical protein
MKAGKVFFKCEYFKEKFMQITHVEMKCEEKKEKI